MSAAAVRLSQAVQVYRKSDIATQLLYCCIVMVQNEGVSDGGLLGALCYADTSR